MACRAITSILRVTITISLVLVAVASGSGVPYTDGGGYTYVTRRTQQMLSAPRFCHCPTAAYSSAADVTLTMSPWVFVAISIQDSCVSDSWGRCRYLDIITASSFSMIAACSFVEDVVTTD